jgi:phosphoglucosamine mutase
MATRKYFGTDGIRGRVGEAPITADFLLRLGWAAGSTLRKPGGSLVLIGKDTRLSGYMLESVLEAGMAAAGVDVRLLGPMPTPAIAYLTRTFGADAGIVISASHNPYYDNGIKFFTASGHKLADEHEAAIEVALDGSMQTVASDMLGRAARVEDATGRYIEFCKASVARGMRLHGLHVVVDCAHGATYNAAPAVFSELGARVTAIGVTPNGLNINDACGSTHPEAMARKVVEVGADLGIAFDGDGDRVVMADHRGEVVDGDEILYIIARQRLATGELHGGVVGTQMSNLGLERALEALGVPFERARVGDRYVMEKLLAAGWTLGGESSGHIVCLDRTTTGDGIIAALQALSALREADSGLHDFKRGIVKLPQTMINVASTEPGRLAQVDSVRCAVAAAEAALCGRGRVLLRPSGTEPVVRVMVEGDDEHEIRHVAQSLADLLSSTRVAA